MSVPSLWVLDTNIVLDLWVFNDPLVQPLRQLLGLPQLGDEVSGQTEAPAVTLPAVAATPTPPRWLATPVMREELARVLTYPHLVRRQALDQRVAEQVLAAYDSAVTLCPVAPKARFTCTDADDQKFIDLAAAHACPPPLTLPAPPPSVVLVSKDKAVLHLRKRLAGLGVWVGRSWPTPVLAPAP
jgi:hypothetical protein